MSCRLVQKLVTWNDLERRYKFTFAILSPDEYLVGHRLDV